MVWCWTRWLDKEYAYMFQEAADLLVSFLFFPSSLLVFSLFFCFVFLISYYCTSLFHAIQKLEHGRFTYLLLCWLKFESQRLLVFTSLEKDSFFCDIILLLLILYVAIEAFLARHTHRMYLLLITPSTHTTSCWFSIQSQLFPPSWLCPLSWFFIPPLLSHSPLVHILRHQLPRSLIDIKHFRRSLVSLRRRLNRSLCGNSSQTIGMLQHLRRSDLIIDDSVSQSF